MNRCSNCQKSLYEECGLDPFDDWLKVMHYLEIELMQGDMTEQAYDTLTNSMMTIRPERRIPNEVMRE